MADTADLVVLGAFYGQGSKGQGGLCPRDSTSLKGTIPSRGWPFYWLDLPAGPVLAPASPVSPQEAISELQAWAGRGQSRPPRASLAQAAHHQLFLQGLAAFPSGKVCFLTGRKAKVQGTSTSGNLLLAPHC